MKSEKSLSIFSGSYINLFVLLKWSAESLWKNKLMLSFKDEIKGLFLDIFFMNTTEE